MTRPSHRVLRRRIARLWLRLARLGGRRWMRPEHLALLNVDERAEYDRLKRMDS